MKASQNLDRLQLKKLYIYIRIYKEIYNIYIYIPINTNHVLRVKPHLDALMTLKWIHSHYIPLSVLQL